MSPDVEVIGDVVCATAALEVIEHPATACPYCGFVARCILHGGLAARPT